MSQRLYVGNLPKSVTDDSLRDFFASYAPLITAEVVRGRRGIPRGFGYVELSNNEDAERAITELDGSQLEGQAVTVAVARKRPRLSRWEEADRFGKTSPRRSNW